MIEIKNLKKSYGDRCVYDNFNFSIEEGEITCILGESGCGKTTLLNCIASLCPYEGRITPVKCSYVFQNPRLVPNLTVYGNLFLVCKDTGKIEAMLKRLRIYDKKDSFPKALSGGQARRAAIARAFLNGGVLLLDEPFSSLDLKLKYEISALLKELISENGATAVFVTHDVDEAINLSQRITVLKDGKVSADFKTENFEKNDLRQKLIDALIA